MNLNQKMNIENPETKSAATQEIEKKLPKHIQICRLHNIVRFTLNNTQLIRGGRHLQTILFLSILLFCQIFTWMIKASAKQDTGLQPQIAEEIIRFHVIANSDSPDDQALKLKVKNSLVKSLSPLLSNADSKSEARTILNDNLDFIQDTALETIRRNGYSYPVTVSLTDCYFPMKVYGDYAFPPGTYEALRVQIGEAEGKNWWCVMFPPLCFVDETYSIVDEESKKKLKHVLSEEEYDSLINQKTPVKIKFKLWESLKKLLG